MPWIAPSWNRAFRPTAAWSALALACAVFAGAVPVGAQSLKGSPASLDRQNRQARSHDFTFLDTGARVRYFAERGWLVRLDSDGNFELHGVSYPYTRPEVALFVRRLAGQYRAACGERLVVTSLTRPTTRQPRNASDRSVHPTGMALDLRYSRSRSCRQWLERVLLSLEQAGVLEATRERFPPHYHVAVFPKPYRAYVDRIASARTTAVAQSSSGAKPSAVGTEPAAYKVRSGDSLWTIALAHGTTVDALRDLNRLRTSKILPGQVLEVPRGR